MHATHSFCGIVNLTPLAAAEANKSSIIGQSDIYDINFIHIRYKVT